VPIIAISFGREKALDSILIDPKEHMSINEPVPIYRPYSVAESPSQALVIHRLLIAEDRLAVHVVDDWNQVSPV
jgi:hypothetical protein